MTTPTPSAPTPTVRQKQIKLRSVDNLLLDPENPRLAEDGRKLTQDQLLEKLVAGEALDELATSFAQFGYFWEEPLVVVPDPAEASENGEAGKPAPKTPEEEEAADKKRTYIVVEGNRRFATIRLLLSSAKRAEFNVKDFPVVTPERALELKDVPTVAYSSRADVVPYLGFRHITGAKKWEPYPKARYIAKLVESGQSFATIESAIGDSANTAKKLYQAYIVFGQIRDDLDEDVNSVRESFSLLEVTLGQQPIKNHLGIPKRLPDAAVASVVDAAHIEQLRETVGWVFGSKKTGVRPVITDSREISKVLAPVVGQPESLQFLRETRDLAGAAERSGGEREYLLKQLANSRRAAERALGVCPQHKGDKAAIAETERLAKVLGAIEEVLKP